jgi:Tol biopolymer transport system component
MSGKWTGALAAVFFTLVIAACATGDRRVGAWSPKGQVVVLKTAISSPSGNTMVLGLYLADAKGKQCRAVLRKPKGALNKFVSLFVSPDGRSVAYRVAPSYEVPTDLVVSNVDGSSRRVIATNVTDAQGWVNNHQFVYYEQAPERRMIIIRTDSSAGTPAKLSFPFGGAVALSPDGQYMTFRKSWYEGGNKDNYEVSLNITRVDGVGGSRELYRGQNAYASEPTASWSPNGRTLLVSDIGAVFRIKPDGSELDPLTSLGTMSIGPAWSPNGTKILFTSDRIGPSEVYVINADGTNLRRLTTTKPPPPPRWVSGSTAGPWSPDNRGFAYSRLLDAAVQGLDGTGRRTICAGAKKGQTTYQYTPLAWRR